ncbi:hypothetical protein [Ferroplasma sp.]|uniref:hypothetical protein n=1 Tax=Ferroplasma sp. TaxID=2591003 RepID=UPI00307DDEF4
MKEKHIVVLSVMVVVVMVMLAFSGAINSNNSQAIKSNEENPQISDAVTKFVNTGLVEFGANTTNSKVISDFAYFDNSSMLSIINGKGTLEFNGTLYNYIATLKNYNGSEKYYTYEMLSLFRTTEKISNNYYNHQSWKNTTFLNLTMYSSSSFLNANKITVNAYKYYNKTVKTDFTNTIMPLKLFEAPRTINKIFYKNTSIPSFFNETKTFNQNITTTFSINSNNIKSTGNITSMGNNNITIKTGNINGIYVNSTGKYNYSVMVTNGNATLTIGNDPVNFYIDPQSASRNINNGYEWIGESKASLPYSDFGIASFVSIFGGLLVATTALAAGGEATTALAAAATTAAGFVGLGLAVTGLIAYVMTAYPSEPSNTINPYVELGYWHPYAWYLSWIYLPYFGIGVYTDHFHNPVTGNSHNFSYRYVVIVSTDVTIPSSSVIISTYHSFSSWEGFFPAHTSIFPRWNPNI